jgi:poly-gamma-glutamate synthesis protein (capsule biosynthesis protein)
VIDSPSVADAQLIPVQGNDPPDSIWIYALVAPFPTLLDEVTFEDLQNTWKNQPAGSISEVPLLVAPETRVIFENLWGPGKNLRIVESQEILLKAWEQRPSLAIIPFEELEPRWKVIRINGDSPIDSKIDTARYPLKAAFRFTGKPDVIIKIQQLKNFGIPVISTSNRDVKRMTSLVMTGVTALVRATGGKMDTVGVRYPGRDIRQWLLSADLTHISNEIPFATNCPKANPYQETLIFCSRPEYIELLDDIGTDIVELTGNHMMDWGGEAFRYTLDLYNKRKWIYFGAGMNVEEARKAAVVEHNGNKLAFIGCNPVGPASNWAKSNAPGSANCDYPWIKSEMERLRKSGYLPIMTFQYQEIYTLKPTPTQQRDFRAMAEAGAVIVSGSQSHFPQAFEFYANHFIHYGLGNLFFDQMDVPVEGTRREYIDRHIFYGNQHISTEVLTAMLEDYARPRPMTSKERQSLLLDTFRASGW